MDIKTRIDALTEQEAKAALMAVYENNPREALKEARK